jgi:hypothetical protein
MNKQQQAHLYHCHGLAPDDLIPKQSLIGIPRRPDHGQGRLDHI